jgi:hypothetical protein
MIFIIRGPAVDAGRQRRANFRSAQRRDREDLEPRRRIAQQPVRARGVAGGEHEAVRARAERRDQIAKDRAQAREALERTQLEELVEQERDRAAGRAARLAEQRQGRVERLARTVIVASGHGGGVRRER